MVEIAGALVLQGSELSYDLKDIQGMLCNIAALLIFSLSKMEGLRDFLVVLIQQFRKLVAHILIHTVIVWCGHTLAYCAGFVKLQMR